MVIQLKNSKDHDTILILLITQHHLLTSIIYLVKLNEVKQLTVDNQYSIWNVVVFNVISTIFISQFPLSAINEA